MNKLEARIVLSTVGGRTRIVFYDPKAPGRRIDTGLSAYSPAEVEQKVRQLKQQLERAGNRVAVVNG